MVPEKAIRQAIYERLNVPLVTSLLGSGSASLAHAVAPRSAKYPICIFHKQSGTPRPRMGGTAMDDQLWLVKGVSLEKSGPAEDVLAAVDARLNFAEFTIAGGRLLYCARESDVTFAEVDGDRQFRHHGALYRIVVSSE